MVEFSNLAASLTSAHAIAVFAQFILESSQGAELRKFPIRTDGPARARRLCRPPTSVRSRPTAGSCGSARPAARLSVVARSPARPSVSKCRIPSVQPAAHGLFLCKSAARAAAAAAEVTVALPSCIGGLVLLLFAPRLLPFIIHTQRRHFNSCPPPSSPTHYALLCCSDCSSKRSL